MIAMNKIVKNISRTIANKIITNCSSFHPKYYFSNTNQTEPTTNINPSHTNNQTTNTNNNSFNTTTANNIHRKDSQWIYSTKHQQQQFRKPGTISIYTNINPDTHNTSLRFIQHMENANIIFTNSVNKVHQYFQAIVNKQQYAYTTNTNKNTTQIQPVASYPTSLAVLTQSILNTTQNLQYNTQIQISKYIQLQKFSNKQKGQQITARLHQQSIKLKQYLNTKNLQKTLKEIKNKQGYAAIFNLNEQDLTKPKIEIQKLIKDGLNVMYLFQAQSQAAWQQGKLITQLQQKNLSYQILPCTGEMIEAIVSSGLPADRFCLQLFPSQNQSIQILNRRKNMKITTCIKIQTQKLDDLVTSIIKVLGKQHILYLHSKPNYFIGEASNLSEELSNIQSNLSKSLVRPFYYLILSPFIPQFNTQLKNEMNIQSHIRGQLQSEKINTVEMEILVKKLQQMEQKNYIYQVDVVLMIAQLLIRIKDEEKVRKSLKIMFPRKKADWVDKMIKLGSSKIVIDHIGFKNKQIFKN